MTQATTTLTRAEHHRAKIEICAVVSGAFQRRPKTNIHQPLIMINVSTSKTEAPAEITSASVLRMTPSRKPAESSAPGAATAAGV